MIEDQAAVVDAAVTARLMWSAVEVAGLFADSDSDAVVASHVDLLVDIAAEIAVAQVLRVVVDAPVSDAYSVADMRRVVARIGDALCGRRRSHLKSRGLRATRAAALDACAAVIDVAGVEWWTQRLTRRALSAA